MNRKAFYHLLKRYLEDDCTEEEKKLVEQWYELLGDDDEMMAVPDDEIKERIHHLWPAVQQHTLSKPPRMRWGLWIGAAAVLAGLVIGLYWLLPNSQALRHTANSNVNNDTLYLSDGSMVVLEPNARLHYPDSFAEKREVYLEGNAFFKVAKNAQKPFYVYSKNIVTRVLGTSFFVKSGHAIEVSVCTGKVAVYEQQKDADAVILKPNQKVVYTPATHRFSTTLVEMPLPVSPDSSAEEIVQTLHFEFEEAPISTVLAHLEKAYHIEMVLENESIARCLFTGDIKGQDLYDQLEIICQSVQATYEIRGTRIVINGIGCY
jgi:ferric-dicitrate binding protein FerR (iron transport regulator)